MYYTDDPAADFDAWDAEQTRLLKQRPECVDCGNPIQEEEAYYIDGEWICEDCMDSYKREVMPE